MAITCGVRGSMWPDVARCLATLAPNLAPIKVISSANVLRFEQKAGQEGSPHRAIADPADDRTGEDPPSDDVQDFRALPGPLRTGRHGSPQTVIFDDEIHRVAADSAPLPRLSSPEGHPPQGSSNQPAATLAHA